MMLELKNILRGRFAGFMKNYQRYLDVEIWRKKQLPSSQRWSEEIRVKIEYFERAKVAAEKFVRGNYIGSIKAYFDKKKEGYYEDETIRYFTQRKVDLGDSTEMIDIDDLYDVLTL